MPLLVRRLETTATEDDFECEDEVQALTEALIALARGDSDVTDRVVDLLGGCLEDAPESVRFAMAQVLGGIGVAAAPCLEQLGGDLNPRRGQGADSHLPTLLRGAIVRSEGD